MLSVLIPTYNHDCVVLVDEIVRQIDELGLEAEVIVVDDGSTDMNILAENASIEQTDHCRYIVSPNNVGIARTRNKLMDEARGDILLFLDSDVFPVREDFLRLYLDASHDAEVVVGGIDYRRGKDAVANPLRLSYGISREVRNVTRRQEAPYAAFISSAFLISRKVASAVRFDETFDRYGHEDTLFGADLQKAGLSILHIDNPVYHDNTDSQETYLSKVRIAIQSLNMHSDKLDGSSRLLSLYERIERLHLTGLFSSFFRVFRSRMEANLLGPRPSMFVLGLYKISYLCCVMRL
ncbi:MAG: glycosyltransferase family 2 protein [Bacteroidales bacterium]|nr:glycosyltransferase family 2 protein [Bacteroidales bacterium]